MISRFARLAVRGLLGVLFRVRAHGPLPARGPLLVVANHQGWVDGFLLAAAFPLRAPLRLLGDRNGTMAVWWHRAILRAVGLVIPIDRTTANADRRAISGVLASLARGEIVVVFAEGRVSRAENSLGPLARGIGYLALRSGAPVLPVWLRGTAELYIGRELDVIPGAVIAPGAATPTKEATIAVAHEIHAALAELSPVVPPAEPAQKRLRWLTDLF